MTPRLERLTRRDLRLIALCTVVCLASLWIAVRYFFQVFPEASIHFKVNRQSSLPVAQKFIDRLLDPTLPRTSLPDLSQYRHVAVFDYDEAAKIFLERELGLEKANGIIGREVRLWRWRHRWFRPQQKEELQIDVSPLGEITRFEHLLREDDPGKTLSHAEARGLAENFLQQIAGRNLGALEFVESATEKKANRTDHLFRWKSRAFQWGDAQYRYTVQVLGGEIGTYSESLKVPEEWERNYQKLRSLNETTASIAFIFLALTFLAMLVTLVSNIRHRSIRWRLAGYFGLAGFVLTLLSQLNNFPVTEFLFDTTDTYTSFLSQVILRSLLASGAAGAAIFLIVACAEPLYRQSHPGRISLPNLFRWRGLRSKEFFLGTIIGLTLTCFFFAYDSVFYLVAKRFGAWAPADVPYSDLLNTRIPWAFVLFFGFFPAVSEEFISRMFSIPFFERLFRYRWVAIFLASFIWGFGHANYPNQPFYIRGIEVGVGGLIVSWVFLRFGIIGPLVWHYSVDAFYTAFLLLRSGNLYLTFSGALAAGIMLVPLAVALSAYLKSGGFGLDESLANQPPGQPPATPGLVLPVERAEVPMAYNPLNTRHWLILAGISMLLLIPHWWKVQRFGDFINISMTRQEARRRAEQFLEKRGIPWKDYRSVAFLDQSLDSVAAQYILKHSGTKALDRIYSRDVPVCTWVVRFYRPLQEEEYFVFLNTSSGEVINIEHILSENAAGASLEQADAQQMAERFLVEKGVPLTDVELKEANAQKRKARQDYVFIWESLSERIQEAAVRIKLRISGDQVTSYSPFVWVPEEWRRTRLGTSLVHILIFAARMVLLGGLAGWAFWTFLRHARRGLIRWRPVLGISLGLVLLQFLNLLNSLPTLFQNYTTSLAPNVFMTETASRFLASLVLQFLMISFAGGLLSSLFPEGWAIFRRDQRAPLAMDSLLVVFCTAISSLGLLASSSWLVERFHSVAQFQSPFLLSGIDHLLPALTVVARSFQVCLLLSLIVGVSLYVFLNVLRRLHSRILFVLMFLVSLIPDTVVTPGEFAFALLTRLTFILLGLGFVRFYLRNNLLAYLLLFLLLGMLRDGYTLVSQSAHFFKWNGLVVFLLALSVLVKLWLDARKVPGNSTGQVNGTP